MNYPTDKLAREPMPLVEAARFQQAANCAIVAAIDIIRFSSKMLVDAVA